MVRIFSYSDYINLRIQSECSKIHRKTLNTYTFYVVNNWLLVFNSVPYIISYQEDHVQVVYNHYIKQLLPCSRLSVGQRNPPNKTFSGVQYLPIYLYTFFLVWAQNPRAI